MNVEKGIIDTQLLKQLKKQKNYCNKLIKKEVRENNGKNITEVSNVKEVWHCINDILKPETITINSMKIESDNHMIEDPVELAEKFNSFFIDKVEKLATRIKKNPNSDPFSKLRGKLHDLDLRLKLRTVNEKEVLKILKSLKPKKSCGPDGITSEILKLGAEVLCIPLTYIINSSILSGKYPTNWHDF